MAKATVKTVETNISVVDFIHQIADEKRKTDCYALVEIMKEQSGFEPKLWGPSIIGFGAYHYKYDSGREGEAPLVAFSPRKTEISLYLSSSFEKREALLQKLGKHKSAKACVYIKRLEDVDLAVLKQMISLSIKQVQRLHK
jgi:hypothetical protein